MNPSSTVARPETESGPICYTAAQIAAALGISKRAILHRLRAAPATRALIVNGNAADAWDFSALPIGMQQQLQAEASRRGYRNPEYLLSRPTSWHSAVP